MARIYHVCQCCDAIYKVTETTGPGKRTGLTGAGTGDIMINEPENGNELAPGLCDDCREEVYGPAAGFVQPYRLH